MPELRENDRVVRWGHSKLGHTSANTAKRKNLPPPFRLLRSRRVSPPPLVGGGDTRGRRVSPPRSRMCSTPLLRRPGAFSWQFVPPEISKKKQNGAKPAPNVLCGSGRNSEIETANYTRRRRRGMRRRRRRRGGGGGKGGGGGGGEEKPTLRQNYPAHKVIVVSVLWTSMGT